MQLRFLEFFGADPASVPGNLTVSARALIGMMAHSSRGAALTEPCCQGQSLITDSFALGLVRSHAYDNFSHAYLHQPVADSSFYV